MMDFGLLLEGIQQILQPNNFLITFFGAAMGILFGALPGINASMGVALLLPLTYGMTPVTALSMLLGIYCGAIYGGSITAVLINTPGTTAAACTTFDGHQLAQQGKAGKALGMATIASYIGGTLSVIILIVLAPVLAKVALRFGPPEYFALAVFGLSIITSLAGDSLIKGIIAGVFGLMLGTVGIDMMNGTPRYTFGQVNLLDGVSFIPVLIGLFAVSQVLINAESPNSLSMKDAKILGLLPSLSELRSVVGTILRSSVIGSFVGILPGAGATISSFICYNEAKRWSKKPEEFGNGSLEGIAAPEAGNNAATGGAMVPLLSLGIPGSETTAVLLGAFMIQGISPGPLLFKDHIDVVYGIFAGLLLANLAFLVLGLFGVKIFVKVLQIPYRILMPLIISLAFVGSYSVKNNLFNVGVMLLFGVLGYFMRKLKFPIAPVVLALVLGPMAEASLRRALIMSGGSWSIFVERPITLILLGITLISLFFPIIRDMISKKKVETTV
ncbi:putative tricarboxylic transport membrane protein [Anaerosolibacter carboniphilus]|uniref:Putative tricarboxylic transport membrane protein n=1 Tax=Anaerosolibacter carboniphilus TaxID=1417629 RepID=A0A841KYL5_9FIRM|nr:tripartite tricarboxylate transporter permease [Anaerosolibacter carboniphilus]MBB6218571.1 putative tricarboxylic transport membrane protein [Anaerosolibacter carboniphilus]